MKRYYLLFIIVFIAACTSQETDILLKTATLPLEPTSTNTLEPSDTPQPTNTVELYTETATRPPTLTPAFETGTLMNNEIDGASMAYVPPGEFMMGNDSGSPSQQPAHLVSTNGFWMYQYEVTNAQYLQCVNDGRCEVPVRTTFSYEKIPNEYFDKSEFVDFPVIYVGWDKAAAYCEWAGGRLPTEAEWEMSARGGLEGMLYPWGNEDPVCDLGAVNGAHFSACEDLYDGEVIQVGSFSPNGYGLYDMAGNVEEWVNDYYDEVYYEKLVYDNPQGPGRSAYHGIRGGGFRTTAVGMTVSARNNSLSSQAFHPIGFRCVISP